MEKLTEPDSPLDISIDPWADGDLPVDCGEADEVEMMLVLDFVGGSHGCELFRDYQISKNPTNTHWVLWETIEDEEATSAACITYAPVATAPLEIGDDREAAEALLLALWAAHRDGGYDQPNCMDSYSPSGLLSDEEVRAILAKIWPDSPLLDDASDD